MTTEGSATGPLTRSVKKKGSLQVFFAAAQQAQIVRSTGQYIDAEPKKIRGLAAGPKIVSDMVCGTDDVAGQGVAAGKARYTVPARASPSISAAIGAAGRQRIVETPHRQKGTLASTKLSRGLSAISCRSWTARTRQDWAFSKKYEYRTSEQRGSIACNGTNCSLVGWSPFFCAPLRVSPCPLCRRCPSRAGVQGDYCRCVALRTYS